MERWEKGLIAGFIVSIIIIIVATLFMLPDVEAGEPPGVISTGSKKGDYFKVGNKLAQLLGNSVVMPSKGSVENLDRIMKGEANIAITQMDALAYYVGQHPEAESKIEVMGPLYPECVYLAVNSKGKIKTEDDLQSEGFTVAVGKKGSGTQVTWDYMRQLEPGYTKSAVSFSGGTRALGKLASKPDGDINAVLWVTKPRLDGKLAQTVLKNKSLKFLNVNDKDLNDKYEPTGQPIYRFETIKTKGGLFGGQSVKTICVDAVIVADTEASEDMLEALSGIVLNYKESLLK